MREQGADTPAGAQLSIKPSKVSIYGRYRAVGWSCGFARLFNIVLVAGQSVVERKF